MIVTRTMTTRTTRILFHFLWDYFSDLMSTEHNSFISVECKIPRKACRSSRLAERENTTVAGAC
jgi:hypothetical protein